MRPQPESSTQEVLAGLAERVTYHNSENGFCVLRAKVRGHRDVVTVVGHAAAVAAGEWITVDDTGARHKAANGFCTQIGNAHFAWGLNLPPAQ